MQFRDRPIAVWAFPLAMLGACLLLFFTDAGGIGTRLRGILFDGYQYAAPRARDGDVQVRILVPDAASLKRFGPWPWPHATLTVLTEKLAEAGAAGVVFATPLERPDPASAQNLLPAVPAGAAFDAVRKTLSEMPSPDDALADAMKTVPSVTGFTLGTARTAQTPAAKAPVTLVGNKSPIAKVTDFTSGDGALPGLQDAARGNGALNFTPDSDGKIRRMPLVFRLKGVLLPSLDAEALRIATGGVDLSFKSDDGDAGLLGAAPGIASFAARGRDIPTNNDGSFWIAYAAPTHARDLLASDLVDGKFAPGSLARSLVYLGAPDEMWPAPDFPRSAVSIHAEALENLLSGTALRRPASALEGELICLAVFGLGLVILFTRFGVWPAALFAAVSSAAGGYASWYFYTVNHVLFDALSPSLGLMLIVSAGAVARTLEVTKTKSRLAQMFAESLPQKTIEEISRNPALLTLDGENRNVTYLSCGVRGFSQLSTSFREDPAAFTKLMNRVLSPLMDRALAHGGAIDRLTADGFSAFWNAPLEDSEHAIHACEAAHAMAVAIAQINESVSHERRMDGTSFPLVEIGVGISTGNAIAGGVLTHGRTAYSVNGDCVVTAARIQALSAQYGPATIVTEDTRKAAERGFAFLEVDYIAAGPHEEPVKLYAMLGNPVVRASPKFRALLTFHEHIFQSLHTQQWDKARELIEQCRKLSGASQKLYDLHLARIDYFQENPPGENWDGVFRTILK